MKSGKKMVILGCGYVGSAVAQRALDAGWRVSALTRNGETCRKLGALGCSEVIQDSLDSHSWHKKLSAADVVLNCVSSAGGGVAGYRQSYLQGQESVLTWLQHHGTGCYVYTGATSVYPQSAGETVRETDVPEFAQLSENGRILRQAERMIQESGTNADKSVILRLSGIYGPGRHGLLDKLREGYRVFPGSGDRYLNLVFLPDIVAAIWQVIQSSLPHDGLFNVSDDGAFTKREILEWLADRTGLTRPVFNPDQASDRDKRRQTGGNLPNRIVSNERIKQQIGWNPQFPDFRAGFEQLLNS